MGLRERATQNETRFVQLDGPEGVGGGHSAIRRLDLLKLLGARAMRALALMNELLGKGLPPQKAEC